MKTCLPELAAHLAGEATTLATLWRLTRRDGVVMGFTDHDVDLICDGITHRAASGFTPTALATRADLSVDGLEIQGLLDADDITEEDLLAGVYDGATVDVMLVNHADPGMGTLYLRRGVIGEVQVTDVGFTAELRGMMEGFSRQVGQLYSPTCRASLGDSRCRVDLTAYTVEGAVSSAADRRSFTDSGRAEAAGHFMHGLLTWTGGANAGAAMEVKSFGAGGQFALFLPMRHDIAPGDGYRVSAGCDKTFATCRDRFDNAINFRGEPHVPGLDFVIEPAGR